LVALDPQTGAVKALIGGRDYGASQLNRALSERQPGSVFKPFVYAAALTAYQSGASDHPWTPISKMIDEPTTFLYDNKPYEPANYGQEYFGEVTLRYALTHSLNLATVKLAESIGYDTVVSLARRAGMNPKIRPTPAVALGAYETTPLEVAGAYTIFANRGVRLDPYFLAMVRSKGGTLLDVTYPRRTPVLDPGVAFLMTNLLEDVVNTGTGVGVRARGFTAPAAGKTGTSHDGWFAGYTNNLICVVWVGYDSDLELPLSGASSALPIWTEFMKRAIAVPDYGDVTQPDAPLNVVQAQIDPETGELATPHCPTAQTEFFLAGTEPTTYCHLHYLPEVPGALSVPTLTRAGLPAVGEFAQPPVPQPAAAPSVVPAATAPAVPTPEPAQEKKPGLLRRIFGVFTGGPDREDTRNQPETERSGSR
jgi:penicillin-binding protein 1B